MVHLDNVSFHTSGAVNEAGGYTLARLSDGIPLVVLLENHAIAKRGKIASVNIAPLASIQIDPSQGKFLH